MTGHQKKTEVQLAGGL